MEAHNFPLITMFVRRQLSVYLHQHSYKFFQDDFAGRLAGKVVEMPQAVVDVLNDLASPVQYTLMSALVSTIIFTFLDWRFGLITAIYYASSALMMRWRLPIVIKKQP
jgi:ATP-binding cassette subfamily B protein